MRRLRVVPRRSGLRLAALSGVTIVSASLISLGATPSQARLATQRVTSYGVFGRAGDNHRAGKVLGPVSAVSPPSSVFFLYALDGTAPDAISVYGQSKGGLGQIQQVAVGSSRGGYFGSHLLATGSVGTQKCLYFSEGGTARVYSFTISPFGRLSSTPVSTASLGGFPQDLALDPNSPAGNVLVVSNSNYNNAAPSLQILPVGSGCTLGTPTTTSTGSQDDINIALENPSTIVTADANTSDWETYTINSNGTLTNSASAPPQPGFAFADGVVALGSSSTHTVYLGQANSAQPTAVEGAAYPSYSALSGSPVSNGGCDNGAAIAGSVSYQLVIQAGTSNGSICWDNLTASGISAGGSTSLARSDDPSEIVAAGNGLVVAQRFGGDVEGCHFFLSSGLGGVMGCHTAVTLPGAGSGNEGSVAFFP